MCLYASVCVCVLVLVPTFRADPIGKVGVRESWDPSESRPHPPTPPKKRARDEASCLELAKLTSALSGSSKDQATSLWFASNVLPSTTPNNLLQTTHRSFAPLFVGANRAC